MAEAVVTGLSIKIKEEAEIAPEDGTIDSHATHRCRNPSVGSEIATPYLQLLKRTSQKADLSNLSVIIKSNAKSLF
jgi:hypothetical protein